MKIISAKVFEENIRSYVTREVLGKLLHSTLPDKNTILGCSIVLDTVARTLMNIISASSFFKDYAENLVKAGQLILKDSVQGMEGQDPQIRTISGLNLKSFVEALCTVVNRIHESKSTQGLVYMFDESEGILNLLSTLLLSPVIPEPQLFFFSNPQDSAEESVNNSKAEILDMLKHVVNHLFVKYPPQTKVNTLKFFPVLKSIIEMIVNQVQVLCRMVNGCISRFHESTERAILSCFSLMEKTSMLGDFYTVFSSSYKSLFTDALLPQLLISKREEEDFDHNEVEFVNFSMDVCLDQVN